MLDPEPEDSLVLLSPWLGREQLLYVAGGVVGFLLSFTIVLLLPRSGGFAIGFVLFGVCAGAWLGSRWGHLTPRWTRIDLGRDTLTLHRRDGSSYRMHYDDVAFFRPSGISMVATMRGLSEPADLVVQGQAVQVFLSAVDRGELYRHLEREATLAMISTVEGDLYVPTPPDTFRHIWLDHYVEVARTSFRQAISKHRRYLSVFGTLFATTLALQGAAFMAMGVDAIRGQFVGVIATLGAIAGAQGWAIGLNLMRRGKTIRTLETLCDSDTAGIRGRFGRVRIQLVKTRPTEMPTVGRWCCLLSVPLSIVPVVGIAVATAGLYYSWDRKGWLNRLAWWGFFIGFVSSFCGIGLLIP